MKAIIHDSIKKLLVDRYASALTIGLIVVSVVACLSIGLSVGPSDLQLVTHYSAFGITHLYRDQWFYLLTFVLFPLIICALHSIIAVKLLVTKDRWLAIIFLWSGIGLVLLNWAIAKAILNVWIPL